jgi:hypothetical protein
LIGAFDLLGDVDAETSMGRIDRGNLRIQNLVDDSGVVRGGLADKNPGDSSVD